MPVVCSIPVDFEFYRILNISRVTSNISIPLDLKESPSALVQPSDTDYQLAISPRNSMKDSGKLVKSLNYSETF